MAGARPPRRGRRIASSITQTELIARPSGRLSDFPADVAALVRHGLIPEGSTVNGMPAVPVRARSFVIDADVFCAAAQPWDGGRLERQFSALHGQIDRFFRWTLTVDGERYFGYEEVQQ